MILLELGFLVAGVLALLAREIAAVRRDDMRGPSFVGAETVVVVVSLLILAPRLVELLT